VETAGEVEDVLVVDPDARVVRGGVELQVVGEVGNGPQPVGEAEGLRLRDERR
jgi:hypothetical protein